MAAVQMQTRRTRVDSPARWQQAAARAIAEGVRIAQVQGTGQWIATSVTHSGVAYAVDVTGNLAHGCDCLAGMNDDPVCKHRAAYYLLIGALSAEPEPDPPAPAGCPDCAASPDGVCGACWLNADPRYLARVAQRIAA